MTTAENEEQFIFVKLNKSKVFGLPFSLRNGNVKICAVEKSPKSEIYAISNLFF